MSPIYQLSPFVFIRLFYSYFCREMQYYICIRRLCMKYRSFCLSSPFSSFLNGPFVKLFDFACKHTNKHKRAPFVDCCLISVLSLRCSCFVSSICFFFVLSFSFFNIFLHTWYNGTFHDTIRNSTHWRGGAYYCLVSCNINANINLCQERTREGVWTTVYIRKTCAYRI